MDVATKKSGYWQGKDYKKIWIQFEEGLDEMFDEGEISMECYRNILDLMEAVENDNNR